MHRVPAFSIVLTAFLVFGWAGASSAQTNRPGNQQTITIDSLRVVSDNAYVDLLRIQRRLVDGQPE